MDTDYQTIELGGVSCYLVKTSKGYILIDTGGQVFDNGSLPEIRTRLENSLADSNCLPGNLQLILITHGHFDHTSNAAYLHEKYRVKIAMHRGDLPIVERREMVTWNRKIRPFYLNWVRIPMMFFFRKKEKEIFESFVTFTPDCFIGEGDSLLEYGLDAQVLHLPGHSDGSIGILTASGDLFCGDVMANRDDKPVFTQMADHSLAELDASIERVKALNLQMVYPGHGKPFPMEKLMGHA